MPTPTYDLIEEKVLGSAQASVTFSSIPGTYKDLVLEIQTRQSGTSFNSRLRFNGDTGSNYSRTSVFGNGSAASSVRESNATGILWPDMSSSDSQLTNFITVQIMSYSNTNVHKTSLMRWAGPTRGYSWAEVNLWRSTAAITSVVFDTTGSEQFVAGTTARLWGIA